MSLPSSLRPMSPPPSPVASREPKLEDYTKMSIEFPYMRKSDYPDEGMRYAPPDTDFSPHVDPVKAVPNYSTPTSPYEDRPQEAREVSDEGRRELQEMNMMKNGGKVQSYTTKSGGINLGSGRVSTASKNSKSPKW